MDKLLAHFFIFLLLVCSGCRCKQSVTTVPTEEREHVEVRKETIYVTDTVFVNVPQQQSERTTSEGFSFLENDWAQSTAQINADGSLYHNLTTKPQSLEIPVETKIEKTDSIKTVYKQVTKTIERSLTKWEKVRLQAFWYLSAFAIITVIYICRKYRKWLSSKITLFRS
jgi:hypothetical protein